MTESEAWTLLAEACDKALSPSEMATGDRPHGIQVHGMYQSGLCKSISRLCAYFVISWDTADSMSARLSDKAGLAATLEPYWWPLTTEGYKQRAEICRQLAEETK